MAQGERNIRVQWPEFVHTFTKPVLKASNRSTTSTYLKSCAVYVVKNRDVDPISGQNIKVGVQGANHHSTKRVFYIKSMEMGSVRKEGMFLTLFLSNAAQPQLLD